MKVVRVADSFTLRAFSRHLYPYTYISDLQRLIDTFTLTVESTTQDESQLVGSSSVGRLAHGHLETP